MASTRARSRQEREPSLATPVSLFSSSFFLSAVVVGVEVAAGEGDVDGSDLSFLAGFTSASRLASTSSELRFFFFFFIVFSSTEEICAEITSVVVVVVIAAASSGDRLFFFFFLMRTPVAEASETMSIDILDESVFDFLLPISTATLT